jgi:head-tail adaptor
MNFFKKVWTRITGRNWKETAQGTVELAEAAALGYVAYTSPTPGNIAAVTKVAASGAGHILDADASEKVQAVGAHVTGAGQAVDGLAGIVGAGTAIVKQVKDASK